MCVGVGERVDLHIIIAHNDDDDRKRLNKKNSKKRIKWISYSNIPMHTPRHVRER